MRNVFDQHKALFLALMVLAVTIGVMLGVSLRNNGGHLVYALDDPYIHMAIAKNLATHGVWGVTAHGFASASSSILWTILLSSSYLLFGVNEWTPLLMNIAFATLTMITVHRVMKRYEPPFFYMALYLLAMIFLTPLPTLIFTGQEHILHAWLTILFAATAARELSTDYETAPRMPSAALAGLGALVVMARYEGLFLVFVVCLLFLARRRWSQAFVLGGFSLLPIGIFGVYSMLQGWYPIPTSVLMKGNLTKLLSSLLHGSPTDSGFFVALFDLAGFASFKQLLMTPHLMFLLLTALLLYVFRFNRHPRFWDRGQLVITLFAATALLHMQFARAGWFFRYEAYLIGMGLYAIAVPLYECLPKEGTAAARSMMPKLAAAGLIALFPLLTLAQRGLKALTDTPQAMTNIYHQQYQMGLFFRDHYQGQTILANDIGAINFLAELDCVDLVGMGDLEVAKARNEGRFDKPFMEKLARDRGSHVAVAFEGWLVKRGGVPDSWEKLGEWTMKNNVVAWDDTVAFYALDPGAKEGLIANLRAFSSKLPAEVGQLGAYTLPVAPER